MRYFGYFGDISRVFRERLRISFSGVMRVLEYKLEFFRIAWGFFICVCRALSVLLEGARRLLGDILGGMGVFGGYICPL